MAVPGRDDAEPIEARASPLSVRGSPVLATLPLESTSTRIDACGEMAMTEDSVVFSDHWDE